MWVKNGNFWYKFAPKGKFWGPQKKLTRCTTTKLPVCNGTIIVVKITLLHSVSVITNVVIPKRDKKDRQTDKKHNTFSSSAGARPTIPTILGMVIVEFPIVSNIFPAYQRQLSGPKLEGVQARAASKNLGLHTYFPNR